MAEKKYIMILRCSTAEQSQKGNSLETQRLICQNHPRTKDLQMVAEYSEVISSFKENTRGVLEEVYKRCKRNPDIADYILYQKVDRYFRNTEVAWRWIKKFAKLKIEVNFVEQWIPFGSGGDRLMLNLRLGLAEEESWNTSRRTKQNLGAIKEKGYYVGSLPPKGFRKVVLPNHRKSLEPDGSDTLDIIRHIFKSYLYGNVTRSTFLEVAKQIGFQRAKFYDMFKNPTYAGLNRIELDGEIKYIKADWYKHRVINPEEFQLMQQKIKKQAASPSNRTITQKEKFWLKGHIYDLDGQRMSASSSKGRKKYYSYYHSDRKGSKNIPVALAHDLVYHLFGRMKLQKGIVKYVEKVMRKQVRDENKNRKLVEANINRDLTQIEKRLKEINRQYAVGEMELEEYRELKSIIEEQREDRLVKLEAIESQKFIDERVIIESVKLIPSLQKLLKKGSLETKSIIMNAFFPEGIFIDLESQQVGTIHFNKVAEQLIDSQLLSKYLKIQKAQFLQTVPLGVKDGIRTRGLWNHKPAL